MRTKTRFHRVDEHLCATLLSIFTRLSATSLHQHIWITWWLSVAKWWIAFLLLVKGIVGLRCLLSFGKGWSYVSSAEGNIKENSKSSNRNLPKQKIRQQPKHQPHSDATEKGISPKSVDSLETMNVQSFMATHPIIVEIFEPGSTVSWQVNLYLMHVKANQNLNITRCTSVICECVYVTIIWRK